MNNKPTGPREGEIQDQIRMAVDSPHCRFFRNHVGTGWHGVVDKKTTTGGSLVLRNARKVTFGLEPGSQDLFGWVTVTVTPEMVGKQIAVVAGIEVKRPGKKPEPAQVRWAKNMAEMGAICIVATSAQEALDELRKKIENITGKPQP